MAGKLDWIKKVEIAFRELLNVTNGLSKDLENIQDTGDLDAVAEKLRKREKLIRTIKGLETQDIPEAEDAAEAEAYEKYRWLCREIAKKIDQGDQNNLAFMEDSLNWLMNGVRTARESIRAVNAYAASTPKER